MTIVNINGLKLDWMTGVTQVEFPEEFMKADLKFKKKVVEHWLDDFHEIYHDILDQIFDEEYRQSQRKIFIFQNSINNFFNYDFHFVASNKDDAIELAKEYARKNNEEYSNDPNFVIEWNMSNIRCHELKEDGIIGYTPPMVTRHE